MTIKLIASDLDGTFFTEGDSFNEELFNETISKLQEKNILFIPTTGAEPERAERAFGKFRTKYSNIEFITNNGAYILNNKLETEFYSAIEKDDLKSIWDYMVKISENEHIGISFVGKNNVYMPRFQGQWGKELKMYHREYIEIDSFDEIVEPIQKVVNHVPNSKFSALEFEQHLKTVLPNTLHITSSGWGATDIINAGISKATALEFLGNKLNINPDEMVAFGDGANDLEMLAYAGNPYVMPNSTPDVLKHNYPLALDSNKNDGVLKTINAIINNL
jgi:Cof subfamily protein (haloacid dehalogenase superfamily)